MKILVIDDAFTENIGDKAIEFCMKNLLQYKFSNADISFQSYRGKYEPPRKNKLKANLTSKYFFIGKTKKYLPLKLFYRTRWFFQNFQELLLKHRYTEYDLLIIGGGPLIDGFWMYPFAFWLWARGIKANKIILLGMGYGYGLSIFDKKMVKNALKNVDEIFLRDASSITRFQEDFGVSCKFMPDVAFAISKFMDSSPRIAKRITFFPLNYEVYKVQASLKEIVLLADEYFILIVKTIKEWHLRGFSIGLSTSQASQDLAILEQIHDKLIELEIEVEVTIPKNLESLVEVISSSEIIFSGRMHALIVGYAYDCQCIAFPSTLKLSNFDEEIIKPKKRLYDINKSIFQTFENIP
jgi:polysaccharide pyruvyl transferase WcaK-like protein|nr:polysaccharide pyruvyl transferase family protein [uncultured Emticicia sp.]